MLHATFLFSCILTQSYFCTPFLTEQFINEINKKQDMWRAGHNPFEEMPETGGTTNPCRSAKESKMVRDKEYEPNGSYISIETTPGETESLIDQKELEHKLTNPFFSKTRWPKCTTIGKIPHQGRCANSWAVATAATVSDRLCTIKIPTYHELLSAEDLTTCCKSCMRGEDGCQKGSVNAALAYIVDTGIVTGDHHGINKGCKPYSDELFHHLDAASVECKNKCTNALYDYKYQDDRNYGIIIHLLPRNHSKSLQIDMLKYGPLLAIFQIHKDFFAYQEGIYVPETNDTPSWHTVSLVGWGEENDVKYWWARNTWGEKWGKLGGLFKIRRGKNDAFIESYVYSLRFRERSDMRMLTTDPTAAIHSSVEAISPNSLLILSFTLIAMYQYFK